MQIGEFAKICKTRISVLRHYDKLGLLPPAYTDPFTGYRYYAAEQIVVFYRISALKQAGFSLSEIAEILMTIEKDEDILRLFERKQAELTETLENLKKARTMILEGVDMIHVIFKEENGGITARSTKVDGNDFNKACEQLEEAIAAENYQRVSGYRAYGEPMSGDVEVVCDVVKLDDHITVPLNDNGDILFENDESVVGKWQIVGQYTVKEDFYAGRERVGDWYGETLKEVYFLPEGEKYWCYRWTKGCLICENGDGCSVGPFETEEYDGGRYMFVQWKSYAYRRGGHPVTLVLKQIDNRAYTKEEIEHCDNTDLPFVNDGRISGTWIAHSTFRKKEQFDPNRAEEQLFWSAVAFEENGDCICTYGQCDIRESWTNGYILDKRRHFASAYELRRVNGTDYLIVEWKNGDYRYGGFLAGYYAFTREK